MTYELIFSKQLDGDRLLFQVYRSYSQYGQPQISCRIGSKTGTFTTNVPAYDAVIRLVQDRELFSADHTRSFHLFEAKHMVVVTFIKDKLVVLTYAGLDGSNPRGIAFDRSATRKLELFDRFLQSRIYSLQVQADKDINTDKLKQYHFYGQAVAGKRYVIEKYVKNAPDLCEFCKRDGWDSFNCVCGRDAYSKGCDALEQEHPRGLEDFNKFTSDIEKLFNFENMIVGGVPIDPDIHRAIRGIISINETDLLRTIDILFS